MNEKEIEEISTNRKIIKKGDNKIVETVKNVVAVFVIIVIVFLPLFIKPRNY